MTKMRRGFTLIELMVVGAIAVIILLLAAPSFQQMIEMQRLRSIAAQFATDVQFARSEAPSRQRKVYGAIAGNAAMTCYVIYTCPGTADCTPCNCLEAEGSRCSAGSQELRTQQVPSSLGVGIAFAATGPGGTVPSFITFEPVTGGLKVEYPVFLLGGGAATPNAVADIAITRGASSPRIRTEIAVSGRPSQCAPDGLVSALPACPAPAP
jgi:type IV fimbrial biogenesis protein FimT